MVRTKFPLSSQTTTITPVIPQNAPKTTRPRKLNPREDAFARYLFEGKTQIEARRLAGYSTNMTAKAQYENACFMANSLKISKRVNELREKAADASIATKQECEQVLTEIIRGRVTNFLDDKNNRIIANPKDLNTAAIKEVKTAYVMVGKGEDAEMVEVTELKLHDPVKAIESMAKLNKWYGEEKTGGDTNIGAINILNVNLNDMSDIELQQIIKGELVIDHCNGD